MNESPYDTLVIGGGFFGCSVAVHLRRFLGRVLVVEQGPDLLQRASYNNQARVHQGYHYPRSLLTALRSRVNFDRFTQEYADCVDGSFTKIYAIGRTFSHVTAAQFRTFCERIGAPIEPAAPEVRRLFDPRYIEDVFLTKEWAFDAVKLKERSRRALEAAGVELELQTRAIRLQPLPGGLLGVLLQGPRGPRMVGARKVFNCTYSGINHVLAASGLPPVPLKHEMTEMALVEPPEPVRRMGVTVMCGPFFSIMPFPPRGLHSLSHVRYTPHFSWEERREVLAKPANHGDPSTWRSNFVHMVKDAQRYMPCLADCRQQGSLWEVKTVLPASEADDSRPILFRIDHGLKNLVCLMGGKIDNVYDVLAELDAMRARGEFN